MNIPFFSSSNMISYYYLVLLLNTKTFVFGFFVFPSGERRNSVFARNKNVGAQREADLQVYFITLSCFKRNHFVTSTLNQQKEARGIRSSNLTW